MSAHRAYLAIALAGIAATFVVPDDSWWSTALDVVQGVGAGAAIVVGARRHRSPVRAAWTLFAVGIALNALGSLVEAIVSRVFGAEPFPGVADVFYLALYPGLVAGVFIVVRSATTSRDWGAIADSATITTGIGLLAWVFVIRRAATDPTLGLLGHAVSIAYPVGDVVVLAMLVRLLVAGASRNASFRLMAGSLLLFLAGDGAWTVINYVGWEPPALIGRLLGAIFLVAYACFGVAGLHPSMRDVGEPRPTPDIRLDPRMLALLAAASLIAPAILAYQVARGRVTDGIAIAIGSVALFLLVVARMAQLLRHVEAQAAQLRELARVDELTGLPNRRAWAAELPRAMERARRDGSLLSVALLDLDRFKRFNDEFGHPAGDRLLKGASAAWRAALRAVDELVRYGGEEFVVLLPGTGGFQAAAIIDRLRAVTPAGQTFSAGIATWDGVETSDELVSRADRSLYRAKDDGRDRTVVDTAVTARPS
jgi:diguanylate cyclase (GGDEF)-like protein